MSARKWYYENIFFRPETRVIEFLKHFCGGAEDSKRGIITELSYTRQYPGGKQIPERYLSMELLESLEFACQPADLVRIDFGGVYSFGSDVVPSRDLIVMGDPHYRSFVIDQDLSEERTCGCGKEKKICDQCYVDGILDPAKKIKDCLETDLGLVYMKDFLIFFSGNRGFHVHIRRADIALMKAPGRAKLLDFIASKTKVVFTDQGVTTQLNHLLRLPFTLHEHLEHPGLATLL